MPFGRRLLVAIAALMLQGLAQAQCTGANVPPAVARFVDLTYLAESPGARQSGCGWRRVMSEQDVLMHLDDSVKLSVFERTRSDGGIERAFVFEGSKNGFDWVHNFSSHGVRLPSTHAAETAQVFQQADAWAAGLVAKARKDGASYVFVGYSRGAEFAQRSAGIHAAPGITFNGPSPGMGLAGLTDAQLKHIRANVLDLHAAADPLLLLHALSQSAPVARTLVVTRQGGTPLVAAKDLLGGHTLAAVREALLSKGQLTEVEPLDLDNAITLANEVTALVGGLKHLATLVSDKRNLPIDLRLRAALGADRLESLGNRLEGITELADYARALQQDLAAAKRGELVWLRSQTLDAIGTLLVTGTQVPGLKNVPVLEDGLLPLLVRAAQKNGLLKFVPAVGKTVSDFGALNFIAATRDVVMDGHISIDAWEKGLDGAVGLTWSLVGLRLSGNHEVAKYTGDAAVALAATSRLALRGTELEFNLLRMFDWSADPFHQQAGKMIDQYREHIESAQRHGGEVLSASRFFGGNGEDADEKAYQALHASGLSDVQIATLKSISSMVARPAPKRPQAQGNEGGARMDMTVDDSHFRQKR